MRESSISLHFFLVVLTTLANSFFASEQTTNHQETPHPHCTRTFFPFPFPFFFPTSSSSAGPSSASAPHENPVSPLCPQSLLTLPLPYPNIEVTGFGAAGSAGNASPPGGLLGAGLAPDEADATHEGRGFDDPPARDGSAGNAPVAVRAGGGGARELVAGAVHELAALDEGTETLGFRVAFFSFRTLVECFCAPAAPGAEGDAVAADAHPLLAVVAPCMPPSPGSEG